MFYEHYYGFALKTVFRYIYKYEKATDVVNDSFVKVFNSLKFNLSQENLDTEKILMGWMKRILINTAIDELSRSQSARKLVNCRNTFGKKMISLTQSSDRKVLYKELICEIKRLPQSYRTVFNLFVIDGFSHNEIAGYTRYFRRYFKICIGKSKSAIKKIYK